jgi:hypothetical protein
MIVMFMVMMFRDIAILVNVDFALVMCAIVCTGAAASRGNSSNQAYRVSVASMTAMLLKVLSLKTK